MAEQRDSTDEWVLAEAARPTSWGELEERVDYAVAVARASERAALEIGAAAIDAAEEARRAADLAAEAAERGRAVEPAPSNGADAHAADAGPYLDAGAIGLGGRMPEVAPVFDSFRHFNDHADRVIARLRQIQAPA